MREHRGHVAAQKERPRMTQSTAQLPQLTHRIPGGCDVSRQSVDQPCSSRRERLSDVDRARRSNDTASATSSLRPIEPVPITIVRGRADSPVRPPSPRRSQELSMNRPMPQLETSATPRPEHAESRIPLLSTMPGGRSCLHAPFQQPNRVQSGCNRCHNIPIELFCMHASDTVSTAVLSLTLTTPRITKV